MSFGPIGHRGAEILPSILGVKLCSGLFWTIAPQLSLHVVYEIKLGYFVLCKSIKKLPIISELFISPTALPAVQIDVIYSFCSARVMTNQLLTKKLPDAQHTRKTHIGHAGIANQSDGCSSSSTSDLCESLPWTGGSWRGASWRKLSLLLCLGD